MISIGMLGAIVIGLALGGAALGYVLFMSGPQRTQQQDFGSMVDLASKIATIGGTILAVAALLAGLVSYNITTQYQNRAEATSTFQSYAAVRAEHPRPLPRVQEGKREGKLNHTYGWVALQAFAAAETIYLGEPS